MKLTPLRAKVLRALATGSHLQARPTPNGPAIFCAYGPTLEFHVPRRQARKMTWAGLVDTDGEVTEAGLALGRSLL